MTLNKLASEIAKKEGKKTQVAIGNIREVLKLTLDSIMDIPMPELIEFWQKELAKRQKKLLKKKK